MSTSHALIPSNVRATSGKEASCEKYSDLYGVPPSWGMTGIGNEDLTRNIMCCLEEPLVIEPGSGQSSQNSNAQLTDTETDVLDIFKPQWFGREEGYQGTTHSESLKFCQNVAGE